jgi:hypothetical protein
MPIYRFEIVCGAEQTVQGIHPQIPLVLSIQAQQQQVNQ